MGEQKFSYHFRSGERKFLGAKACGSESSLLGTFAAGSESTEEQKGPFPILYGSVENAQWRTIAIVVLPRK